MKIKIWVDCDGVLADFHARYIAVLNQIMGTEYVYEDFVDFDFAKVVGEEADDWVWRYIDASPGFVKGFQDLPESQAGLMVLRNLVEPQKGFVGCLTSPHIGPHWMYERYQWLFERGFTKRNIVMSSDKGHAPGNMLIDDRYKNCVEWLKTSPNGLAFLMDAPYNQNKYHPKIIRCRGWEDVISKISVYV